MERPPATSPVELFFRKPLRIEFQLSPSGRYLAFMERWKKRWNLQVRSVDDDEDEPQRITEITDRDIHSYFWLNDDRLVFLKDRGGDENWRLYTVSRSGGGVRDVTPDALVRVEIIDQLRFDPEHVMVGLNHRDARVHDAYLLHVESGRLELLEENPGDVMRWMTDHEGMLRLAVSRKEERRQILIREEEDEPFRPLMDYEPMNGIYPL